jgi:hypothetical protein
MMPPALWPSRNRGSPGSRDLGEGHEGLDVVEIVRELLDVETLAVGLAAAALVERVHRETIGHELLGRPRVVSAVGVHAVDDGDDDARLSFWPSGRHHRTKISRPLFPLTLSSFMLLASPFAIYSSSRLETTMP